jgi:hypothetical protein
MITRFLYHYSEFCSVFCPATRILLRILVTQAEFCTSMPLWDEDHDTASQSFRILLRILYHEQNSVPLFLYRSMITRFLYHCAEFCSRSDQLAEFCDIGDGTASTG